MGVTSAPARGVPVGRRDTTVLLRRSELNFQAGRYTEAYDLLLQAWAQQPTFEVAALLGSVELQLQRYREAAEHLRFSLHQAPPTVGEATLAELRSKLADARAAVASLRIRSSVDGAQIQVDGQVVGVTPLRDDLFLEPGTYAIEASLPGQSLPPQRFVLAAGETRAIDLQFPERAPALSPAPQLEVPARTPSELIARPRDELGPRSDTVLYVGGSVASLALASGAVMLLFANATATDAQSAARALSRDGSATESTCREPSSIELGQRCDALQSMWDREARLRNYAFASLTAGAVTAIASTVYYLVQPRAPQVHFSAGISSRAFDIAVVGRW